MAWTVGVRHAVGDHLELELRYADTDHGRLGKAYEPRLVAKVSSVFY